MGTQVAKIKTHSSLGASSAYRWMICPGSRAAHEAAPPIESIYAKEGQAAHDLAEACLIHNRDTVEFIDRQFGEFIVDEEMADAVQEYVDHVRKIVNDAHTPEAYKCKCYPTLLVETRFELTRFGPPVPMFGTSDAVVFDIVAKTLHVIDYKHGKGWAVEAIGNHQGRYYALGVLARFPDWDIKKIVIWIVQPRAPHRAGPIRSEELTPADIYEWSWDLFAAADRTLTDDTRVAGEHCKFCNAAGSCGTFKDFGCSVFEEVDLDVVNDEGFRPPKPEDLTPQQLADILRKAPAFIEWLKIVKQHVYERARNGEGLPGMKLVSRGRGGRRFWLDEDAAALDLSMEGLSDEQLYKRKLISPAQAEKALGKGGKDFVKDMVGRKPAGTEIVPISDERPALALPAPGDEFEEVDF